MSSNEIVIIEKKVNPLVERALSFVVKNPKQMKEATDLLSQMNSIGDKMEAEKRKVVDPLNLALKNERARWKPLESAYESGIAAVRKAMSAYQTAEKAKSDEKADAIAARVGAGKGKLKAETASAQIDELDKPEAIVATDKGVVKFRTVKKFEVLDISKLPVAYVVANEVAIKSAMRDGLELPGVRYYTEEEPINFR